MPTNERTTLTREQFNRFKVAYPSNLVMVEMEQEKDLTTSAGIKVNFNPDVLYAEGESSHVADCAATHGKIVKQPDRLYYKRKDVEHSMSWKTELETMVGDIVFFHHLISKNCDEVLVDGVIYKMIPYEDLFVAKRGEQIIPLNGNIILQEVYKPKLSRFDISEPEVDKFKGIVRWIGKPNQEYQAKGIADIRDIEVGQTVLIDKSSYPYYLERSKYNSHFDKGNQYLCVQGRHIEAVI